MARRVLESPGRGREAVLLVTFGTAFSLSKKKPLEMGPHEAGGGPFQLKGRTEGLVREFLKTQGGFSKVLVNGLPP